MTAVYPPDKHLLRDLRFSFEHDDDGARSRAWMPVVDELCTDLGQARAGALATLVDVIGGGVAANAAAPGWIATADLTLHLVRGARPGSVVEARASVLRAGRTTVVIEVALDRRARRERRSGDDELRGAASTRHEPRRCRRARELVDDGDARLAPRPAAARRVGSRCARRRPRRDRRPRRRVVSQLDGRDAGRRRRHRRRGRGRDCPPGGKR